MKQGGIPCRDPASDGSGRDVAAAILAGDLVTGQNSARRHVALPGGRALLVPAGGRVTRCVAGLEVHLTEDPDSAEVDVRGFDVLEPGGVPGFG